MIKKEECIGCQACVDICPTHAISFEYDIWGEGRAKVNINQCVKCKKCISICPSINNMFNEEQKNVYAVTSKNNRKIGSSGGFFYELAKKFVLEGGIVYGAAFDENLRLIHKAANNVDDILPLCKSKYIHSDARGIYNDIGVYLQNGKKVLFVGTPCQVSAVKNLYKNQYPDSLFLIDFLCHGAGTQKIFDLCIKDLENKLKGKIKSFVFRSKSRRAEHSFTLKFKRNDVEKVKKGYSFEFSYYYSYLRYIIFCNACYKCKYSKSSRIGDLTLGDFWGIQNFNKKLNDVDGVSFISVNNESGKKLFNSCLNECHCYEYPIEYAKMKNQSLNQPDDKLPEKLRLEEILINKGDEALIEELSCKLVKKQILYANTPQFVIDLYHKIIGRKK